MSSVARRAPQSGAIMAHAATAGLQWDGRWGKWADAAVHILAACVGDLEVIIQEGVRSNGQEITMQAAHEVGQALREDLPQGAFCVNIHWVATPPPTNGRPPRHILRAALVCETAEGAKLQRACQRRPMCGGAATVSWLTFNDTATDAHGSRVQSVLAGRKRSTVEETGFLLQLPTRWLALPSVDLSKSPRCVALNKGNHWYDFCSLFGKVMLAELVFFSQDPDLAQLLVQFSAQAHAYAMFEALWERYLYNPENREVDDTHPVVCAAGRHDRLRLEALQPGGVARAAATMRRSPYEETQPAQRAEAQATPGRASGNTAVSTAAGFVLRRSGAPNDPTAAPQRIQVVPSKPRIVIGRDDSSCDVLMQRAHLSKSHATLELRPSQDGTGWNLIIQDTSVNGTWVNGSRLISRRMQPLQVGSLVSFLPASHAFYSDSLSYQVEALTAVEAVRAAAEAALPRRPNNGIAPGAMGPPAQKRPRAAHSTTSILGGDPEPATWLGVGRALRESPAGTQLALVVDAAAEERCHRRAAARNSAAREIGGAGAGEAIELVDDDPLDDPFPEVEEDIGKWVSGLDGGSLAEYEECLRTLFENVSQIKQLYVDRLQDFFEDVGVKDGNHRLAFASAFRALR